MTRNRLIASFGAGTVIVEAAARSGALSTARHCQLLGRPLMVVPGPVTSPMSAGCHALLRAGGMAGAQGGIPGGRGDAGGVVLVSSVEQVLEVVGSAGEGLEDPEAVEAVRSGDDLQLRLDRLDPVARRVFDGMPMRRAVREEDLARRSGVTVVEVIRALPALAIAGLVEASEEGFRVAPAFRRRSRPRQGASGVAT